MRTFIAYNHFSSPALKQPLGAALARAAGHKMHRCTIHNDDIARWNKLEPAFEPISKN
jgi:hypothetical protein